MHILTCRSVIYRIFIPLSLAPLLTGCAHTVQSVASTASAAAVRAAAPALVDQIDELNKPENQKKLATFASSPAMRSASRDVGNDMAQGFIDAFISRASGASSTQPTNRPADAEEMRAAVASLSETIADAAVRGSVRALPTDASPMLAQAIRQQIGPAIGDAVRQQLAQTLNQQSQSALMQSLHNLMHQEIMPAVRELWDQGASDTLLLPTRPDLAPAMRENANNLAFGTAIGTHQALIQLGVLSPTGGLTGTAKTIAWVAGIVLILVGLAALAMLIVLFMIAIALWRRPIAVK